MDTTDETMLREVEAVIGELDAAGEPAVGRLRRCTDAWVRAKWKTVGQQRN